MVLDRKICYQALSTRDKRFDGSFFVAVRTTRIYCRTICPARRAMRKNVDFYRTAAEAELAGYRPCKRCRPETAPGSPAWCGTSATVSRALRLLSRQEGVFEGVEALAVKLGVSDRRLRQLFQEHLGIAPKSLMLVNRLSFARALLDQTRLSVTDVAFCSGFQSIRRFNDAFIKRFGLPPSQLRKQVVRDKALGEYVLKIPYRAPYHWKSIYGFLNHRAVPGVEACMEGSYVRTYRIGKCSGILRVRNLPDENALQLSVSLDDPVHLLALSHRVRVLFDTDADIYAIERTFSRCQLLKGAVKKWPGLRVPGAWNGFESAVRAIVGQQVSVVAARTLMGRIAERCGRALRRRHNEKDPALLFPTPEELLRGNLSGLGITQSRINAIRALASQLVQSKISLDEAVDLNQTRERLLDIPGLGPWTVNNISMRVFRDPDIVLEGDLGIKKAFKQHGLLDRASQAKAMASWHPWGTYASAYLWQLLEELPKEPKRKKRKRNEANA